VVETVHLLDHGVGHVPALLVLFAVDVQSGVAEEGVVHLLVLLSLVHLY